MKVKAEGNGYNGIYTARKGPTGWYFIEPGGTYLTPGLGLPMVYDTEEEMWQAVQDNVGRMTTPKVVKRVD